MSIEDLWRDDPSTCDDFAPETEPAYAPAGEAEPGDAPWTPYDGSGLAVDADADAFTEVVYGAPGGLESMVDELWHQLAPGQPLPSGPHGRPASFGEVLTALRGRTDDPLMHDVIDQSLTQWQARS